MKKITLIAAVIVVAAFSSCKKTWTCECTVITNGVTTTESAPSVTKMTKKDAKTLCEKESGTTTVGSTTISTTCKLK